MLWLPGKATPGALPVGYRKAKGRQPPRAAALAACCRVRLQLALLARCVRSLAPHCWPLPQLHQAAPGCCQCSPASCCRFRCSQRPALPQLLPRPKPGCPGGLPLPGGRRPPRNPLILLETSYGESPTGIVMGSGHPRPLFI